MSVHVHNLGSHLFLQLCDYIVWCIAWPATIFFVWELQMNRRTKLAVEGILDPRVRGNVCEILTG